jgi:naphthalene 1,2-dioxygenase system ferredoxin subunit
MNGNTMSEHWVNVVPLDAVPEGEAIEVECAGRPIALYRVDGGNVYATHAICTHAHARLAEGFLEGHEIECPLHQGKFDVRTGKALCAPLIEDVRVYPVRVQDGEVLIDMSAA